MMSKLQDSIPAIIDAAREVEAAIDAWGKLDVSDKGDAEQDAVLKTGHALYLALLEYDRAIDFNRKLAGAA